MRKNLLDVLLEEYAALKILDPPPKDSAPKEKFESLEDVRAQLHKNAREKKRLVTALCLSGGGIRSATFGLGVLQGLAKHNFLNKFDYLSTVSGGGYIGSWLSAWIKRKNIEQVQERLSLRGLGMGEIEPPEITHLRSYSNYMSPRPGLFSADTWTLAAVYLRNLLLNWMYLVPLLMAILLFPRLYLSGFRWQYTQEYYQYIGLASGFLAVAAVANIVAMRPFLVNFFNIPKNRSSERWVLIRSVLPLVLSAFGMTIWWFYERNGAAAWDRHPIVYFMAFGVVLFWGGYLASLIFKRRMPGTQSGKSKINFWKFILLETLPTVIPGIIGGALLYLFASNFTEFVDKRVTFHPITFYVAFGAPLFLLAFLLSATLFVGIASRFTDDMDHEWMARFAAWVLIVACGWSFLSGIVLFAPVIFEWNVIDLGENMIVKGALGAVGGVSGLVALLLGFSGLNAAKEENQPKNLSRFLLWFAPQVAAPVFVVFLVIFISYSTSQLLFFSAGYAQRYEIFNWLNLAGLTGEGSFSERLFELPGRYFLLWTVLLLTVSLVMGRLININKFSFHAIYRERLIRAYLGASRSLEREQTADSFTGLDNTDDLEMNELNRKPMHVVNMTLNLVKTSNLRWQNRKASSFTATALHCGISKMDDGTGNYRASDEYGKNRQNGKAITLGTAAAISGAAASPNMGYYTSSFAVSFLMALFNVRLGWWLGNPGVPGDRTYNLAAPKMSLRPFIDEAFGRTTDRNAYIYLSDGGHFDNLGLYEMVLRRCHLIVVSDAGCDGDFGFSDFGASIHKIRVDMGIPIEFEKGFLPVKERNCGIGKIRYTAVDGADAVDGILVYIKPTLDGDEPVDIKNYKKENPDFPHESTVDQFYSESQFESYRTLGLHQVDSICCRELKCICEDLEFSARNYLKRFQETNGNGLKKSTPKNGRRKAAKVEAEKTEINPN